MGRDNKRHPNGTVLIEPRSSAKPISEAPVPLLAAVIPVVLAPAAPPVVLLATWDITVLLLLAELFASSDVITVIHPGLRGATFRLHLG